MNGLNMLFENVLVLNQFSTDFTRNIALLISKNQNLSTFGILNVVHMYYM